MATRNTVIVARYGRANDQIRLQRGPRDRGALDGAACPAGAWYGGPMRMAMRLRVQLRGGRSRSQRAGIAPTTHGAADVAHGARRSCSSACRARRRAAVGVAACTATSGVATERRRPGDATAPTRATPTPTDRRPRPRRTRTRPTPDRRRATRRTDPRTSRSGELQWSERRRGRRDGAARGAGRLRGPRRPARSSCSSPAIWPTTRRTRSGRCSSTRAGPGFGGVRLRHLRRSDLRRGAARAVRHHRLGPAGHRPERAGDRLHRRLRPLLLRDRHHAGRRGGEAADRRPRRGVRRQLRREQRRLLRVRRHQQQRPRHGLDPPGARRGPDQLLRLQLRQRARRDVGDAVPRDGAGRGARRRVRPQRRRSLEGGLQQAAGFEGTLDDVPRPVQRRPALRVPQRRRRRGRVRRPDARARRRTDPVRGRPARHHPGRRAAGRRPGDVLADVLGPAVRGARRRAGGRRVPGCSPSTTATTSASPTARGATSWRRSRRSRAWTTPSAPPSRRTTPTAPQFIEVAPRFMPNTTGTLLLHVLPALDRPAGRDHGSRRRPDRRDRHDGDPATPLSSTRAMADTLEDGRLVVVDADQHTGYGSTTASTTSCTGYLVDLEVPADETEC